MIAIDILLRRDSEREKYVPIHIIIKLSFVCLSNSTYFYGNKCLIVFSRKLYFFLKVMKHKLCQVSMDTKNTHNFAYYRDLKKSNA